MFCDIKGRQTVSHLQVSARGSVVHGGRGCRRPPVAEVGAGVPLVAAAEPGDDLEVPVLRGLADAVTGSLHLTSGQVMKKIRPQETSDAICAWWFLLW